MENKTATSKFFIGLVGFCFVLLIESLIASGIFLQLIEQDPNLARPWTTFQYYQAYPENKTVIKNLSIGHGISGTFVIMFLVMLFWPKKISLFGDAKWAKWSDISKSEVLGKAGIIVGRFKDKLLFCIGTLHVIIAAPTRAGKGVGFVIPNLLNWKESCVVTDMKLENYEITSKFRKKHGQKIYLFNPVARDYRTDRWNPLSYVSDDKCLRIDDVDKIANFLIPTPHNSDPMWTSEGRKVFMGFVLFLLDREEFPTTLGEVFRQLHTEKPTNEYIEDILEDKETLDPLCVMYLSGFMNMPDKQREGVKSTVTSALNIFSNPLVDAATSESDFDFRDLRRINMSIYVGITPDNVERMAPILRLFFQQIVDVNTRELPNKKLNKKLLLIMDEFARYGYMESIVNGSSYVAGYNIRLAPIIQDDAQLLDVYGEHKAKTFIGNMAVRIVYPPKDPDDAEKVSRTLGTMTVKQASISKAKGLAMDEGDNKVNQTISETGRALMLAQEIRELPKTKLIILAENTRPILGDKLYYYKDKEFVGRYFNILDPETTPKMKFDQTSKIEVQDFVIRGQREFDLEELEEEIPIPEGNEELTEDELDLAADAFLDSVM